MRIAYLCTDFGIPIHGAKGASIHVRELSRALRDGGHAVRIYAPRTGGEPPAGFDVPVHALPIEPAGRRLFDAIGADPETGPAVAAAVLAISYASALPHRIAAEVARFAPDAIYERYALFGTTGAALAEALGVPLILEVNAPLADEAAAHRGLAFPDLARQVERHILQSADHVIAVSAPLADWIAKAGVPPERITVLPNGVDPARFAVRDAVRAEARARLEVAADRPVVGFVGTLKPWHDVGSLVEAMGLLRARGGGAHLLIVGDGPERPAIEAAVLRAGIGDGVTFTGTVPHADVPRWLAAMDVAVAPYAPADDFYFSPLKLFEAMAAGRPVVAAAVGQLRDSVRHGQTGLLYAPGDAGGLADAIAAVVADPGLADRLGRGARAWVRGHRTWQANAERVAALAAGMGARRERIA